MKFSIITPCKNAGGYLHETIDSVLNQTAVLDGSIELDYIICDGGSSDETRSIVEGFNSPAIRFFSQTDKTMYDALSKGFRRATGDVIAYINSGDYYHKSAFSVVRDIFVGGSVQWLTGFKVGYNDKGQVFVCHLPYRYRERLFRAGLYNGKTLPHLEQESTFWSRTLQDKLDLDRLAGFKYAGDYFLWRTFSQHAPLHIAQSMLGGHRRHSGQLSENLSAYNAEVASICASPEAMDMLIAMLDKLIWYSPNAIKQWLNKGGIFRYDLKEDLWKNS